MNAVARVRAVSLLVLMISVSDLFSMSSCMCKHLLHQNKKEASRGHLQTMKIVQRNIWLSVPIAERYRLRQLTLFGSYARGQATMKSDLDFRVDLPDEFGMFRLGALQSDLEDAFHKKIALVTEGMLNDPLSAELAENIQEDEVILYGIGE